MMPMRDIEVSRILFLAVIRGSLGAGCPEANVGPNPGDVEPMAAPREPVVASEPKSPPRMSMRLELSAQPGERNRWALIILGVAAGFGLTIGGVYHLIEQDRKPTAEIVLQREVPELNVPATVVPPASQASASAASADQPTKLITGPLPPAMVTPDPPLAPPSSLVTQPDPKPKAAAHPLRAARPPRAAAAGQIKF